MPASTTTGNAILDCYLRGVNITAPSRVWISLHTADPGNNGANEVSTANWPDYVRQDPADGDTIDTGFDAASGKATTNAKQLLFPRHTGASNVTISHACVWTAETGGTVLLSGELVNSAGDPTTKTIQPDDECVIYAGEAAFEVV